MSFPLRRHRRWRKRWHYVAAFSDELMACAARVEVGPLGQTFWALLDRRSGELIERTRTVLPGAAGEVTADRPGERGATAVVEIRSAALSGRLRLGQGRPWDATCRTRDGEEVWTRKRAGLAVECDLRAADGRTWRGGALGIEDETCGYHPRHTVWRWSSGVGLTTSGRPVAWNLVEGINDPPAGSERAIWVDGEPFEPAPVSFEDLRAIRFTDGAVLRFSPEAERRRRENKVVLRYSYRQPFGTFSGSLPGGLELASATGVMEHHDAVW